LDRRHAALPLASVLASSRRAARAVGPPSPPSLPQARSPRTRIPPPRSQRERDRKLRRKPHPGTQTQTCLSVRPPRHRPGPPARRRARSLAAGVVCAVVFFLFFLFLFLFFLWLARSRSHPLRLFLSNATVLAVHFGPLRAGLSPVAVAAVHRRPARRRPPLFPTGETPDAYRRRPVPRLLLHVLAPKGPSARRAGSFGRHDARALLLVRLVAINCNTTPGSSRR